VGLTLVVPAALALVVSYVAPTVWTVRTSFAWAALGSGKRQGAAGLDNYRLVSGEAGAAFKFALSLAVLPLLTLLVVAPLLAYAAHRAGRPARWLVRLALTMPMVCWAPTGLATAWLLSRGHVGQLSGQNGWVVRLAVWLTLFGLLCGVGVTLFLAALRRRELGHRPWPAMITVGGLAALAVVAAALQEYAYPAVLSAGAGNALGTPPAGGTAGPGGAGGLGLVDASRSVPRTPMLAAYQQAFSNYAMGPATAIGALLLAALAVLGLVATAAVIFTGLRAEVDPVAQWSAEPAGWRPGRAPAASMLGLLLAAVLVITGYGLWPWLTRLSGGRPPPGVSTGSVLLNTWLPPLVSTVVGVGLALLAGFGIGALRPLGRWSELLLLPFAPWLFVGLGPVALAGYDHARAAHQLNSFAGLIPPSWLAIPALVIFTLVFRGQRTRWPDGDSLVRVQGRGGRADLGSESTGAFVRAMLRPALPVIALVGGATLLVQAQNLSWSHLVSSNAEHLTGPLLNLQQLADLPAHELSVGLVLPAVLVLLFAIALGALQLFFLERVALRVGRSR
jgi:ABC-type sugar transport system permease subunit